MDPGRGRQRPDLNDSEATAPSAPARHPLIRAVSIPLTWHILSLVAGAVLLVDVTRDQWFYGDEWAFLADRSITIGDVGMFQPHNEHWSTTPVLIYGLLFRVAGLDSYLPYIFVVILAHLVVVHLMWRVMLRGGVQPWIGTAFCAAFIPFGPGADNLLWGFQIGFVGAVASGLGAILIADHATASGRRMVAGWGASVLALTFAGIAVPLVAAAAVVAWMRRGAKAFLIAASIPAAVYVVWLITAGKSGLGTTVSVTEETVRAAPAFLARSGGAVLSMGTPTLLAGLIPLAVSAGALVVRRSRGAMLPHAAIAAGLGQVLLLVIFALGRSALGLESADATRYVYIGGALLLPLLLVGLSDLAGRRVVGIMLVSALAVPWGLSNARLLTHLAGNQAEREGLIREQILAAGTVFAGRELLRSVPEPRYSPNLDLDELLLLLPRLSPLPAPSRAAVIRAALALQVSVTSNPQIPEASLSMTSFRAFDAELRPGAAGCRLVVPTGPKPRINIPAGSPSSLAIRPDAAGELELLLSSGGVRPDYFNRFPLAAGALAYVNVALDSRLVGEPYLILRFPKPIEICPVDAPDVEP